MAAKRLRKGHSYRQTERPFTRISKNRKKAYIKTRPQHKIARFVMGNKTKTFSHKLDLYIKGQIQIRHNALEAARQVINRRLTKLGAQEFKLVLRVYPHQIQRENKMLGGQHSDRIQMGMKKSYGKPTNVAAQVKVGQDIFTAYVNEKNLIAAKNALMAAKAKLPYKVGVTISDNIK